MQQQIAQQKAENDKLRTQKIMAEDKAAGAEGYIDYLKNFQGGNR